MLRSLRSTVLSLALLSALVAGGCTTRAGWVYNPNPAQESSVHVPLNLAVAHFTDQRASDNSTYLWLCVIPLVPYCTADYNRPDTANGFLTAGAYNFRPSDDLAEATATELRQTRLFNDVYVTNRDQDPGAQLMLHGTVVDTSWDGTRYGYMLGPYSFLLNLFGAPVGSVQDALKLRLQLVETVSGRVLWTTDIDQSYEKTIGIYYNWGTDFGYPQMFRDGIQRAITSLEAFVREQPSTVWLRLEPEVPSQPGK
jgi:hypothetical protein